MRRKKRKASLSEIWLAHSLAEMLCRTNRDGEVMPPTAICDALCYLLEQYCAGSRNEFERRTGISMDTSYSWFSGRNQPNFGNLIHILKALKVSPSDLFLTRNQELDLVGQAQCYAKPKKIRSRISLSIDTLNGITAELEKQLRSTEPLAGMAKTAAKLGVSYMVVRYHLPDKYDEYRNRWVQESEKRIEDRKRNRIERVCDQAKSFLSQGVYPSQKKLRRTGMVSATDLARPDVRKALEELFYESGWRPGGARL